MHMADALTSPLVAGVAGAVSGTLLVIAAKKVRNSRTENIVPLMGVMGAFIFVAQMINFSIPGTGSSGHIVGGVLLAALLGPWAALITLASVLVIQCLIFADGGLMALGCNIFNMAVCTCLIAYPFFYKPLMKYPASLPKIIGVSVLTCVAGLELGAFFVTLETEASGITALPLMQFLWFMLPIHLFIGIGEGLATAAVIYFIQKYKPELLMQQEGAKPAGGRMSGVGKVIIAFAVLAVLFGISFQWLASSNPDGLEWSIANVTGSEELPVRSTSRAHDFSREIQDSTTFLPDYHAASSGIIGAILVVIVTWGITRMVQYKKKPTPSEHNE